MIQSVGYHKIDRQKYQACILNASNYKIYAEDWYLDIVAQKKWFALVYNDYEAVMPVVYSTKFGVPYVYQPMFCQQLGVFYNTPVPTSVFDRFLKKLQYKFVRSYCFNDDNHSNYSIKGRERSNYILPLDKPYEELYKNYNRNTKRNVKKSKDNYFLCEHLSAQAVQEYIDFKSKNSIHLKKKITSKLKSLLHQLQNSPACYFCKVGSADTPLSMAIFVLGNQKLYYLNGCSSPEGKNKRASFRIFDAMIYKYANTIELLDFEGSDIEGIAHFFKGFGGQNKLYSRVT